MPAPINIIDRLDISSYPSKIPPKYTHVLNLCTTPNETGSYDPTSTTILNIPLEDIDTIKPHLPLIINFITTALEDPRNHLLVHCMQGQNRSAAAVIAYLCSSRGIDTSCAIRFLKERKSDVKPFRGFMDEIDGYIGKDVSREEDPLVGFAERLRVRNGGWTLPVS